MLTAQLGKDAPEGQCLVRREHSATENAKRKVRGHPKTSGSLLQSRDFTPEICFFMRFPLSRRKMQDIHIPGGFAALVGTTG